MTNRIYAAVDPVQPAADEPMFDRPTTKAKPLELPVRDDAVLAIRQLGDLHVTWSL